MGSEGALEGWRRSKKGLEEWRGVKSENSWSTGGGVPVPVAQGTGNVYSLWLPVCFQPLTSPFVSHQAPPHSIRQYIQLRVGGAFGRGESPPEAAD